MNRKVVLFLFSLILLNPLSLSAEDLAPLKLGFIGSLSGFASSYGSAVQEGAQLALEELRDSGVEVELIVEDDASETLRLVSAWHKLYEVDKIQALITGSWWARAIVDRSEKAKVPLLSCETVYDLESPKASTYFIMGGDLKRWLDPFAPLVTSRGFKSAAIVRYVSAFGATLAQSTEELFSKNERSFLGDLQYNDVELSDATPLALKLKKLKPEVVFVDGQPGGLANLLRKFQTLGLGEITVFTHSIGIDLVRQKLVEPSSLKNFYFVTRTTYSQKFRDKFYKRYQREPQLNADLGYNAVYLSVQALRTPDPIASLKSGKLTIDGVAFEFNENNVYLGVPQELWTVEKGQLKKVDVVK